MWIEFNLSNFNKIVNFDNIAALRISNRNADIIFEIDGLHIEKINCTDLIQRDAILMGIKLAMTGEHFVIGNHYIKPLINTEKHSNAFNRQLVECLMEITAQMRSEKDE